ncbi:MAG: type II toxin-antitoxin system prevent-host-death family antitoxin [Alphaproteobacteria bacterium]|nr:type II toxin-antitoxin system prevent-host-death family antitoxin [Alphaproteobacteria bacterium]
MKTVSDREANQAFSKLLAYAAAGEEVVITRRGKPIARLLAVHSANGHETRRKLAQRMLRRLRRGYHLGGIKASRDEI